jgi:predicted RNase H-like HicB family nuclease
MNWNSTAIQITIDELEEGGFFVESIWSPGCWGSGETEDAAIRDYVECLPSWVEVGGQMWVRRENL